MFLDSSLMLADAVHQSPQWDVWIMEDNRPSREWADLSFKVLTNSA